MHPFLIILLVAAAIFAFLILLSLLLTLLLQKAAVRSNRRRRACVCRQIREMLPGTDCGDCRACCEAGTCAAYAEAVTDRRRNLKACPHLTEEQNRTVAGIFTRQEEEYAEMERQAEKNRPKRIREMIREHNDHMNGDIS